jgi:hypothetical protein
MLYIPGGRLAVVNVTEPSAGAVLVAAEPNRFAEPKDVDPF